MKRQDWDGGGGGGILYAKHISQRVNNNYVHIGYITHCPIIRIADL